MLILGKEYSSLEGNYCVVDEFHVDVDCTHSGDEESDADGGIMEHVAVERPQRVFGLFGVGKLHQAPVLRRTSFQRYLLVRQRREQHVIQPINSIWGEWGDGGIYLAVRWIGNSGEELAELAHVSETWYAIKNPFVFQV